jgi:ABC-2 type transport system permease protein
MSAFMIKHVARKEVREIVRDGRMRLLGVIVLILSLAALAFGAQQALRAQEARANAMERAEQQWEGQGERNPHSAAHYGTHVFAPTSVVTAIDPGVSPYLGRSVEIKAHKRSLASHSEAQDSGGSKRLGSFSVASVFLLLIPLLIIALGYGLWSRERERGTLRQVLSTGVQQADLFWGKMLALCFVLLILLVPAALIIVGVLWGLGGGDEDTLVRLGLLALGYGAYFGVFAGLTLFASAIARTSRGALVAMVGLWGLFCLVTPRAATEVAGVLQPLPSQAELGRQVAQSLKTGLDGKTDKDVFIEAKVADTLEAEGVSEDALEFFADDAEAQRINTYKDGLLLKFTAEWENVIFDHYIKEFDDQVAAQESVMDGVALLSPYVAMRTLSAALSGTDFAHHRHFTEYAETWRQGFVDSLNKAFADKAGTQGWSYRAGPELWKNAPAFAYQPPRPTYGLDVHALSALALLGWLLFAFVLARWAAGRVKVV